MLVVLDHPDIPLHNNSAEQEIRFMVLIRKISFGTRNENGSKSRDTFMSLLQTCKKLGISFWGYIKDRVYQKNDIPRLKDLIYNKMGLFITLLAGFAVADQYGKL